MTALRTGSSDRRRSGAARRRGMLGWLGIAVFAVVIGIAGAALSGIGEWSQRDVLDPESRGPSGTAGLVALLRERGVAVSVARDRAAADEALAAASEATLVMADSPLLSDGSLGELTDLATDVVLIDPRARAVELLFPGATAAGFAPATPVRAGCDDPTANRAGTVVPGRLLQPGTSGATACFETPEGFGLLLDARAGGVVSTFDGRQIATNEHLGEHGNAALALGLIGRLPTVVWYVPGPHDADAGTVAPSLGALTPAWVTPSITLLCAAAIAAALWRGRRFGPLVVEDLPVTVRAAETMEGRGRLYARGRDTVHAADSLRIGAVTRLSALLGLSRVATAHEVADAAADRVGAPRAAVRALLVDDLPRTDAELVAVSDGLRDIEAAVRAAIRQEGRTG